VSGPPQWQPGNDGVDPKSIRRTLTNVQIAAKYLTAQLATRGEDGWNGALGGEPGNSPSGHGFFDQLDTIAA
jgi:hypothetical protein